MRVDRFFITEQYDMCRRLANAEDFSDDYDNRDLAWPVFWDTETTGLEYGLPNVLFDPESETVISEQLYPTVFGLSCAFVMRADRIVEGDNGLRLTWGRRRTGLYDVMADKLTDNSEKIWHNAKYDLRVCEANGMTVGGIQGCTMIMSRMYWDRRRSVGLKKLAEFLCPGMACWNAPVDREMTRLKNLWTRRYNAGEYAWYDGVPYANYSFVSEAIMGQYASLDVFVTTMLWMRLQGECRWR